MLILIHQKESPYSTWSLITSRNPGMADSQEGSIVVDLLRAYEMGDAELLKEVKGSSTLKYLDIDVVRLIPGLPDVPKGGAAKEQREDLQAEIEEEGFC